jgi:hypothetical protein
MTREEPSLETLWLQNIRTMDKVQIIDRGNTAPSSKTFGDEVKFCVEIYQIQIPCVSRDSSVRTMTDCRLDKRGFDSRLGKDFSVLHTGFGGPPSLLSGDKSVET